MIVDQKLIVTKDTPMRAFHRHWQFCVGSPHATYALRRDWFEQLKRLHEELGVERVRFHGILSDDMHTYHQEEDLTIGLPGPGITEESFRWCGVAYDNVLAAGMKPFVELSFMPGHLAARDEKGMFFYKPNITPPSDYKAWGNFIRDFIRYLIDRYGSEEVETWYFEVWNEPDLPVIFFNGTQEEYFKLYEVTVRAIKDVDSKIIVGGPSTSGSKWLREFIACCEENRIPLDFVSTHQYSNDEALGGIPGETKNAVSHNDTGDSLPFNFGKMLKKRLETLPEDIRKDSLVPYYRYMMGTAHSESQMKLGNLINSARFARVRAKDYPLYYTEWNLCSAFAGPANDTRKVAAYDVHTILNTQDTIDGSSIWCFTDLFEELHPFAEEFHGGFGMQTQSGIRKPVYRALQFLKEAGNERYDIPSNPESVNGDPDIAVFVRNGMPQILLGLPDLSGAEDICRTIELTVPVEETPKKAILRRIDENHVNPKKVWEEMGSPKTPNLRQVREIEEVSAAEREEIPFTCDEGMLTVTAELHSNDLWFITFE